MVKKLRLLLWFSPLSLVLLACPANAVSVKLDWNPLAVPNSTCGPANYINVWRSDIPGQGGTQAPAPAGSPSVKIASLPLAAGVVTTYTDTTAVAGKTYYYTLSVFVNPPCGGVNGSESLMSNEVQAVIGQAVKVGTTVLKQPTILP